MKRKTPKALNKLTAALLLCLCGAAAAASLTENTLAQIPLSLPKPVPPSIIITLDNSGSMHSYYNELNYNKNIKYSVPPNLDGTPRPDYPVDAPFLLNTKENMRMVNGSVQFQGLGSNAGFYTTDRSDIYLKMLGMGEVGKPTASLNMNMRNAAEFWWKRNNGQTETAELMKDPEQVQNFANWAAYHRVRMWAAKAALAQFLVSVDPSATQENNPTTPKFNIGFKPFYNIFKTYLALYERGLNCPKDASGKIINLDSCGVRERNIGIRNMFLNTEQPKYVEPAPFNNAQMKKILAEVYRTQPGGYTPIQEVALDVANKFKSMPETSSCRQYYHIMISDGSSVGLGRTGYGSRYDTDRDLPVLENNPVGDLDGKECSAEKNGCWAPKEYGMYDAHKTPNTFADVALHQYMNDLYPSIADNAPPTTSPPDPPDANKGRQRIVTFTVGIGVEAGSHNAEAKNGSGPNKWNGNKCRYPDAYSETYDTDVNGFFADLKAGNDKWGSPIDGTKATRDCSGVNDLWHAAVNGRGRYFQTTDASSLVKALQDAFSAVEVKSITSTREAISSTVVEKGMSFEPSYMTGTWEGSLKAYRYSDTGAFSGTPVWKAEDVLPAHGDRKIFTTLPSDKAQEEDVIEFTENALSNTSYCNDGGKVCNEELINYLRGDNSHEEGNGTGGFRKRINNLGDIVNASPLYVTAGTHQGYSNWNGKYNEFFNQKLSRAGIVYAGANDGMLHAFRASDGVETFAYIPRAAYKNLSKLASPTYSHRYFVDGALTQGDAYVKDESKWKSVLLVTLGAGGKGLMALDITDPSDLGKNSIVFDNTFATGMEMPDSDERKLGFIMGEAHVVNVPKDEDEAKIVPNPANLPSGVNNVDEMGEWYAIFGNGYASKDGQAALGLKKLDNSKATYITAGTSGNNNGLSEPTIVYDNYSRAIGAYAGDLDGNLWYFDIVKKTATKLLETGRPITTRPIYREHPKGGHMIAVGTGKYLEITDGTESDNATEALYAVWYDKNNPDSLTGSIMTRNISDGLITATEDNEYNMGISNKYRGWKLVLDNKAGTGEHERVIAAPVLQDNMFIVKTFAPTHSGGECASATGDSWLYALDINTGGTTVALSGKDRVKLSEGGTSGIALVTKGGKVYIRTKGFSEAGTDGAQQVLTIKSPGYRIWHKLPTHVAN